MRGLPVIHAAELPDAMARVVYPALMWSLSGPLHPHPDRLGERDYACEMVASHAHVFENSVSIIVRMTNNQIDDFFQNRASFFETEKPVEYGVFWMLEVAPYRIW